jgi:hypothetical protein
MTMRGEVQKTWRGQMREQGKYTLMNLICWFLTFVNRTSVWRPPGESRNIWMEVPVGNRSLVPAVEVSGKRLPRGPNLAIRRSDL